HRVDEVVSMTSGREILLGDARRGIERQLTAASEVDLADIGFAAWLLGWNDSPFDIAGATKAAIEHRTRGYRDVAALGFLAELTSPACTFRDELKEGLSWLSNRPT